MREPAFVVQAVLERKFIAFDSGRAVLYQARGQLLYGSARARYRPRICLRACYAMPSTDIADVVSLQDDAL
eukprot:2385141-Rhodomonas_salina.3